MKLTFSNFLILVIAWQTGTNGARSGSPKIVCYYATFINEHRPFLYQPENIPFHLCNSIVLYHEQISSAYEIQERDKSDEFVRTLVETANSYGTKVMLAIGGYHLNELEFQGLASPSNLEIFKLNLIKRINKFNFSGVLIDWAYPRGPDNTTYTTLLERLSPYFAKKSWTLAISGPNEEELIRDGYETKKISRVVDEIHVNVHHLPGFFEKRMVHHSPLFPTNSESQSVEELMHLWHNLGVPKGKLYMATFVGGITSNPEQRAIPYFKVCYKFLSGEMTEVWDSYVAASIALPAKGYNHQPISFESTRSLQEKANYVRIRGYGGIAFKFINEDDFRGLCGRKNALLNIIHETFIRR